MTDNIMGNRIHQKRKEYGLTMEELGAKLGVNKSAVNKWEKGEVVNIKQSTIKKMAGIFDVAPAWLMGIDSDNVPVFDDDHIELIALYSALTPEQKQSVMELLRSFHINHI